MTTTAVTLVGERYRLGGGRDGGSAQVIEIGPWIDREGQRVVGLSRST